MLTKLDIKTEFIDGLRKTTEDVMDVVEMILTGTINNSLTKRLNDADIKSVGISGADANLLTAEAIHYRSEEHTSELQSRFDLVCRLLLEHQTIQFPPTQ